MRIAPEITGKSVSEFKLHRHCGNYITGGGSMQKVK
jgi:hypothetical protein